MGRPLVESIPYFSHYVGLSRDIKLRKAKIKFGAGNAIAIYTALLELAYGDKGYYIPYGTQVEKENCIWSLMEVMQGKHQPEANTIAEVIAELVECELFSGCHYPKIITSKRLQSTFYSATVERKSVVIDESIWMLTLDEMSQLSTKHSYYLLKVSQSENEVNRSENEVNRSRNPQSKVKESKVNKSKGENITRACARESLSQILPYIEINCEPILTESDYKKIASEFEKSAWLKTNFTTLAQIHNRAAKIIGGVDRPFVNSVQNTTPSKMLSADELNELFSDINPEDM